MRLRRMAWSPLTSAAVVPVLAMAAVAAVGCGQDRTGAHVYVRLGSLQYDELRLGVTRTATGDVVVDPATTGRYTGPFHAGDQDAIIYLSDTLDGSQVRCDATALVAGAPVGSGAADMLVARGAMKTVEIVMGAPGSPTTPPPDPTTPPPDPTTPPPDPTTPPPDPTSPTDTRKPTAAACSLATECLTGHCVDGVCCESDCMMACRSCALPDTPGLCRPVPGGSQDPRGKCADKGAASCQTSGLCDVGGDCAVYPAGTVCQPGGCSDNGKDVMPTRMCNGTGKCDDAKPTHCPDGTTCTAATCS
jgi:hypothetical protein